MPSKRHKEDIRGGRYREDLAVEAEDAMDGAMDDDIAPEEEKAS